VTGDGELQEGQIWESLLSAVNFKLHEIVAIVDHNKAPIGHLRRADQLARQPWWLNSRHCWHVQRCDGHDVGALRHAIARTREVSGQPHVIIADTVKGRGVSFMEHTSLDSDVAYYRFHSGHPTRPATRARPRKLIGSLNTAVRRARADPSRVRNGGSASSRASWAAASADPRLTRARSSTKMRRTRS